MIRQDASFPFDSVLHDERLDRVAQLKQADVELLLRNRNMFVRTYSDGSFLNVFTNKPMRMMRSFRIRENEKNLFDFFKRLSSTFSPTEDIDKYRSMVGSVVKEEDLENRRQGLEAIQNKIKVVFSCDLTNLEKKHYVNIAMNSFSKLMLNGELDEHKDKIVVGNVGFAMPIERKRQLLSLFRSKSFESFKELSTNKDLFFKNKATGETYSLSFSGINNGKINCNVSISLKGSSLAQLVSLLHTTEVKEITSVEFNDKEFANVLMGIKKVGISISSLINEANAEAYKKLMRARKMPVFKDSKDNHKKKVKVKQDDIPFEM